MPDINVRTALTVFRMRENTGAGKECRKILNQALGESLFNSVNDIVKSSDVKKSKKMISEFYHNNPDVPYLNGFTEEDFNDLIKKTKKTKRVPMEAVMDMYNSGNSILIQGSKDILIEDNSLFIHEIIHKRYGSYSDKIGADLYQAGCIGMLESLNGYKPELGAFTTYAQFYIMHQISKQVNFHNNDTTVYYNKVQQEIKKAKAELEEMVINPTVRALSLWTGIRPEIVQRENDTLERTRLLYIDDEESGVSATIKGGYKSSPEAIFQEMEKDSVIREGLKNLPENIQKAILLREDPTKTNAEIARELGISVGQLKGYYQTGMRLLRNNPILKDTFRDYVSFAEDILYSEEIYPERSEDEVREMIDNLLEITGVINSVPESEEESEYFAE